MALADDAQREILTGVQAQGAKSTAVTRRDIRQHVRTCYNFPAIRGLVNLFMVRHANEIYKMKSRRHEAQRLEVPRCFLLEAVWCITQFLQERPSELVFNLGEIGTSDWKDRTAKSLIVPKTVCEQTIHHEVNRNLKYISVTAWTSAAGESLTPYVVTSQDTSSVRTQLKNAVYASALLSL
jgi:hypothetical protein